MNVLLSCRDELKWLAVLQLYGAMGLPPLLALGIGVVSPLYDLLLPSLNAA